MKIIKVLIVVMFGSNLSGCGEATATIKCGKPTAVETRSILKMGVGVSVDKAQEAIDALLGGDLIAALVSSDPDNRNAVAATYQSRTCHFINSVRCGDLWKSECAAGKEDLFKKALGKIDEQRQKMAIFERQVASCIDEKTATILVRSFSQEGAVSCPSGGCAFKPATCNRREASPAYEAPPDYHITSYELSQGDTSRGITGPIRVVRDNSGDVTGVSAVIACDPPDLLGSVGGWNKISLVGKISHRDPEGVIGDTRVICKEEVRATMWPLSTKDYRG